MGVTIACVAVIAITVIAYIKRGGISLKKLIALQQTLKNYSDQIKTWIQESTLQN